MFIQDSVEDNKIYFLRQAQGYQVGVGETWHVTNRYRIYNGAHP
jgi:hypothetical protein